MNVEFLILYALILSITLNIMYFIRKHINSNEAKNIFKNSFFQFTWINVRIDVYIYEQ